MSQGHRCDQRFRLDGNLRANLNRPLDRLSLSGCYVRAGCEIRKEHLCHHEEMLTPSYV